MKKEKTGPGSARYREMARATLEGRHPQGWFIPYRYRAALPKEHCGYPAVRRLFDARREDFSRRIGRIGEYAGTLRAMSDNPAPLPRFRQDWFPRLDAAMAYTLIRDLGPRRIVEVGSGHSTRFMARAIADGGLATRLTAIDPAPRAAVAALDIDFRHVTVHEAGQEPFAALAPGDILFIDSSHILMPGSDVDLLFNIVMPSLPAGVLVHIHDICLPDDYPPQWQWRAYNEQLGVVPMLTGGAYEPVFSSWYAATAMKERLRDSLIDELPLIDGALETSLWLRKKR